MNDLLDIGGSLDTGGEVGCIDLNLDPGRPAS